MITLRKDFFDDVDYNLFTKKVLRANVDGIGVTGKGRKQFRRLWVASRWSFTFNARCKEKKAVMFARGYLLHRANQRKGEKSYPESGIVKAQERFLRLFADPSWEARCLACNGHGKERSFDYDPEYPHRHPEFSEDPCSNCNGSGYEP